MVFYVVVLTFAGELVANAGATPAVASTIGPIIVYCTPVDFHRRRIHQGVKREIEKDDGYYFLSVA